MKASNFRLPPAQWAELRRLLAEALDVPPDERDAWIDALPPKHAHLVARLRGLLSHTDARAGVVDAFRTLPKVETREFAPRPADAEQSGDLIGPYRLLRTLGEGGMASVWLAEHTGLEARRVALKLPHGTSRRRGLLARFARERAILAGLEHPHIARLYDAGLTDAGQPYLALEYVDGERIDRWCDQHDADVPARLALFLQVCDAVAHAHARLIVHRDIKPSNVLVDDGGQVHLLDFGIAKLLQGDGDAESALTREAGRALTPEYAAPEQIDGSPVATSTDTYAMGVLLYELLAGRHPYASTRTLRAARDPWTEPARPSDAAVAPARKRALRGDLDTIVLKAMKRRPEQRYASAEAFAADVRRYLGHEPVLARPDGKAYRLRKLMRRHRVALATGTTVALALLAGATLATWQAREARLQRDAALQAQQHAEREQAKALRAERVSAAQTELAGFLLMELADANSAEVLAAQLERARQMFDAQYRDDPALRGRLLLHLGGLFNGHSDRKRAQALWAEAEPLLRDHGEWEALAELLCFRARGIAQAGQMEQARNTLADAESWLQRANAAPAAVTRRDCLASRAVVERAAGNTALASALLEQAIAMEEGAARSEQATFVELLNTLARTYYDGGRHRDAVATTRRAGDLAARLGLGHTSHEVTARGLQAIALREGGRPLDALALQTPFADAPGRTTRISIKVQQAWTLLHLGRLDTLPAQLDELLVAARPLADGPTRELLLLKVQALSDLGRWRDARPALAEAETMFATMRRNKHYGARRFAFVQARWALAAGELDRAQAAIDEARAIVEAAAQSGDPAWHPIHALQARVHLARGRAEDALQSADDALGWARRIAIDREASLQVGEDYLLRAQAQRLTGRVDAARADGAAAERHARLAGGDTHPLVRQAQAEAAR